jgi:hypothetical protein
MESLVWENVLDQQKSGTRTGGSWFIHSRLGKTSPGYNVNCSFFIVLDLSLAMLFTVCLLAETMNLGMPWQQN